MDRRLPAYSSHRSPSPTGDFSPIEGRCWCPPNQDGKARRPPFRLFKAAAEAMARAGILNSTTPVMSYRCHGCKQTLIYTAADLGLASPVLRGMSS